MNKISLSNMPDWTLKYIPCLGYLMLSFKTNPPKLYWKNDNKCR